MAQKGCFFAACLFRISKAKNAKQLAAYLRMNLAALGAGAQHDLAAFIVPFRPT